MEVTEQLWWRCGDCRWKELAGVALGDDEDSTGMPKLAVQPGPSMRHEVGHASGW